MKHILKYTFAAALLLGALVLGAAGGVGAAAVELGKAMGARVVAAASTNDKVQFALDLGADNGLIYPSGPMDKAAQKELSGEFKLAAGRDGADVVYDAVGGDYADPALRASLNRAIAVTLSRPKTP